MFMCWLHRLYFIAARDSNMQQNPFELNLNLPMETIMSILQTQRMRVENGKNYRLLRK